MSSFSAATGKKVYRLSSLFENAVEEPELELKATVYNINDGNNEEMARQAAVDDGKSIGIELGREKERIASIKSLMDRLNLTADGAMDALAIPQDERPKYTDILAFDEP